MRIVLATADNLEHVYVANRLAAEVPLDAIVVDHGRPISLVANVRRLYHPGSDTFSLLLTGFCCCVPQRRTRF